MTQSPDGRPSPERPAPQRGAPTPQSGVELGSASVPSRPSDVPSPSPDVPSHPEPPPPGAPPQQPPPSAPPEQVLREQVREATADDAVIDTDRGKEHGLDKCPRCGSSEVRYSIAQGGLVCGYCRNVWNEPNAEQAFGLDSPIAELHGDHVASGAQDRDAQATTVTLKCQGCGAEVVIKTEEALQSRCHWCRQVLSLNHQVANGAVPDAVLPFLLPREAAVQKIQEFVSSRRTFADRAFVKEFVPENVNGVYVPYMVVDGNLHAELQGAGEITTRTYTVRRRVSRDRYVTERYWDASVHSVGRKFDILVNDLTAGSSRQYDHSDHSAATNYILDAVHPFDTGEAVAYNSNYLAGFTSEKRDLDIGDIGGKVEEKFLSIAREKARPTVSMYDRGVRWSGEGVVVHGSRWLTMYVPIWLYSYYHRTRNGKTYLHYIAVNGRTGRTMGSVPVSRPRMVLAATAASGLAGVLTAVAAWGYLLIGM